ncbi:MULTISPECIES: hypothetical protein [unclassified Streptomyces]|uniref:hypothetical protein n=1 Tax=unclassified Streptomyces TaxID=2593676 RepID=UPI0030768F9A
MVSNASAPSISAVRPRSGKSGVAALSQLPDDTGLDGEQVVWEGERLAFEWLQQRLARCRGSGVMVRGAVDVDESYEEACSPGIVRRAGR